MWRRLSAIGWRPLAAGLVLAVAAPGAADEVVLLDGTRYTACRVVSENAKEVRIASPDKTIPTEQVDTIQYAERPLEFRQAELFFKSGSYERAVQAFEPLVKSASPAWVAPYAAYYRAVALQKWAETTPGKAPEAVKALNEFAARHGDSRFVYEARLSLAQVHALENRPDDVRRLAQAIVDEKPNTRWAQSALFLLARVKLDKDPQGALKDFDAALKTLADRKSPEWAEATVGKGLALLALNRLDEAERLLEDLIEVSDDGRIRARAYNALGDAYFKKGDYVAARLKYLRVVLLYFRADPVEHAKAMFQAAECFRLLGEGHRANELYKELVEQYPGTPWAAKSPVKPGPAGEGGS